MLSDLWGGTYVGVRCFVAAGDQSEQGQGQEADLRISQLLHSKQNNRGVKEEHREVDVTMEDLLTYDNTLC